jgi:ubiquitin C-terminal hydrolase
MFTDTYINQGELALAFGELLRSLWTNDQKPVAPHRFKENIACFAPQFSGFNQHDSQELLAFLLDGLHEDLNQVKCKPYEEAKDASGRPDEEVADEYWSNHLARNDSVIVDTCHVSLRPYSLKNPYSTTNYKYYCSYPSICRYNFINKKATILYIMVDALICFCKANTYKGLSG